MIRCFVSLCCFTAPGFMLLHAVCGSMLYTDPRLILLPPWICCCMPRSFMRTARTSHDHTSLLRASLPHALCFAVPCFTFLCFAVPCFVADALLGWLFLASLLYALLLHLCCPMLLHLSLVAVSYFAARCFAAS